MKVGSVITILRSSWATTIRSTMCVASGLRVFSGSFQIYGASGFKGDNFMQWDVYTHPFHHL